MVYFARFPTGAIKIGCTNDVQKRVAQLADDYGCKLEVLGTMRGGPVVELRLHRHFKHLRIGQTEQFQPDAELLDYIKGLSGEEGLESEDDDPATVQAMKFKPIRRVTVAFCLDQRVIEEIDEYQAEFQYVTNRSAVIRHLIRAGLDTLKSNRKEAARG